MACSSIDSTAIQIINDQTTSPQATDDSTTLQVKEFHLFKEKNNSKTYEVKDKVITKCKKFEKQLNDGIQNVNEEVMRQIFIKKTRLCT